MKKTIRQYRIAKKRQETKKEDNKKESSQIDTYVSYYELFKSLSK